MKCIYIVDADRGFVQGFESLLFGELDRYKVLGHSFKANDFLIKIKEKPDLLQRIDLLFVNPKLNDLNGLELVKKVSSYRKDINICIVMNENIKNFFMNDIAELGLEHVLIYPNEDEYFLNGIDNIFRSIDQDSLKSKEKAPTSSGHLTDESTFEYLTSPEFLNSFDFDSLSNSFFDEAKKKEEPIVNVAPVREEVAYPVQPDTEQHAAGVLNSPVSNPFDDVQSSYEETNYQNNAYSNNGFMSNNEPVNPYTANHLEDSRQSASSSSEYGATFGHGDESYPQTPMNQGNFMNSYENASNEIPSNPVSVKKPQLTSFPDLGDSMDDSMYNLNTVDSSPVGGNAYNTRDTALDLSAYGVGGVNADTSDSSVSLGYNDFESYDMDPSDKGDYELYSTGVPVRSNLNNLNTPDIDTVDAGDSYSQFSSSNGNYGQHDAEVPSYSSYLGHQGAFDNQVGNQFGNQDVRKEVPSVDSFPTSGFDIGKQGVRPVSSNRPVSSYQAIENDDANAAQGFNPYPQPNGVQSPSSQGFDSPYDNSGFGVNAPQEPIKQPQQPQGFNQYPDSTQGFNNSQQGFDAPYGNGGFGINAPQESVKQPQQSHGFNQYPDPTQGFNNNQQGFDAPYGNSGFGVNAPQEPVKQPQQPQGFNQYPDPTQGFNNSQQGFDAPYGNNGIGTSSPGQPMSPQNPSNTGAGGFNKTSSDMFGYSDVFGKKEEAPAQPKSSTDFDYGMGNKQEIEGIYKNSSATNLTYAPEQGYAQRSAVGNYERGDSVVDIPDFSRQIVAFYSTKGGIGKTSVAVNSTIQLAKYSKKKICFVDFDLTNANVHTHLGILDSIYDLSVISNFESEIDSFSLSRIVTKYTVKDNNDDTVSFDVIVGFREMKMSQRFNEKEVHKILTILEDMYDIVIVDTHPVYTDLAVSTILKKATKIVFITEQEMTALNGAKDFILASKKYGIPAEKLYLVLNRYKANVKVFTKNSIKKSLRKDVFATIPFDMDTLRDSVNTNTPVTLSAPDSELARSYIDVARVIDKNLVVPEVTGGFFSRFKK